MRKWVIAACCIAALTAWTAPSFSMGSGSGAVYGGGGTGFDDYAIAVRLIKHEKYADAIPHLLTALSERPNNADVLNYLGYTERMTGNYPASLDYYQRALAIKPEHKGAHEYLGELYLQMHDPASAQRELDTLASLCPDGCAERETLSKAIATYGTAPASN
ncbi:MAG: tetratricopeptide repeat protein [Rhizomicrobium sp.]